jgi:hypothetical protein
MNQTQPGKLTWRGFLEHRLGSLEATWGEGTGSWLTAAGICNAAGRFDYSRQAGVLDERPTKGLAPGMVLPMNLKSYQEVCRCMMQTFRHMSLVRIALVNNEFIPILGDHPVYLMTETLRMQSDRGPDCDPDRGWLHQGRLFVESCRGTSGGALKPMGELVDLFASHCLELGMLTLGYSEDELAIQVGR